MIKKVLPFLVIFLSLALNGKAQDNFRVPEVKYTIPVVVHIVYKNGDQNLSEDRIHSQIRTLNRDFHKLNPDTLKIDPAFVGLTGRSIIEFRLAETDPDGNYTSGITRTATAHLAFGNNDIFSTSLGGKDPWDETRYLNIWICDLPQGLLGRSSTSPAEGVVIDYLYFGEYYQNGFISLGRTALHEIGHWAGLKHLHATGNCSEDGIADTPVQLSGIYDCDKTRESCGSKDMTQNFMQSNHDTCLLFFTPGQVEFMEAQLSTNRQALLLQGAAMGIASSANEDVRVYPTHLSDGNLIIENSMASEGATLEVIQSALLYKKEFPIELINGINEVPVTHFFPGLNIVKISTSEKVYLFKIYVQNN